MVRYWCENCTAWVDEGDVSEESEIVERGDPPATFCYHDDCGNRVEKPPAEGADDEAERRERRDSS